MYTAPLKDFKDLWKKSRGRPETKSLESLVWLIQIENRVGSGRGGGAKTLKRKKSGGGPGQGIVRLDQQDAFTLSSKVC